MAQANADAGQDKMIEVSTPTAHEQTAVRTAFQSIAANAGLCIIKWIAGYFGNSFALMADAIESTGDIFSSVMTLFGIKYANRPPDKNHPHGHGRAEPLITFLIVVFLVISATVITYQSIRNIGNPHALPQWWTLIVLGGIIIWKEISYRHVIRKGKEINSSALKAEAFHHRSDTLTSIAAFLGISIALLLGEGYESADDIAALVAAGMIFYNSYFILRRALGEIMDEHLYDDLEVQIYEIASRVPGIVNTEKLLIRKAGMKYHVDMHARVRGDITVMEGHELSHHLKDALKGAIPTLGNVLIHIEPAGHKD